MEMVSLAARARCEQFETHIGMNEADMMHPFVISGTPFPRSNKNIDSTTVL